MIRAARAPALTLTLGVTLGLALGCAGSCCPRVLRVDDPTADVLKGALQRRHQDGAVADNDRFSEHGHAHAPGLALHSGHHPLLHRADLLLPADPSQVTMSPTGSSLAWVARSDGVWTVEVRGTAPDATTRTVHRGGTPDGIRSLRWTHEDQPRLLFEAVTAGGPERSTLLDPETGLTRALTVNGVAVERAWLGALAPDQVLVLTTGLDGQRHLAVQRLDDPAVTSSLALALPPNATPLPSATLTVPLLLTAEPTGSLQLWRLALGKDPVALTTVLATDASPFRALWVDPKGDHLLALDRSNRERVALVQIDGRRGHRTVLVEHPEADIDAALVDPATGTVHGASLGLPSRAWLPRSDAGLALATALDDALDGTAEPVAATAGADRWLLRVARADGPARYHLYAPHGHAVSVQPGAEGGASARREGADTITLSTPFERVAGLPLSRTRDFALRAVDGRRIPGRLTLPAADRSLSRPASPRPAVMLFGERPTEAGPSGWSPRHEWLADRGYVVIEPDLRGTRGYGRSLEAAGWGEWGRRVQGDVAAVFDWAVREGFADASRTCSLGFGWAGGYSALSALIDPSNRFACVAAVAPGTDLGALSLRLPPAQRRELELLAGPDLAGRSLRPAGAHATETRTLLIGGTHDAIVPAQELGTLASALGARGLAVTLAVVPDLDHPLSNDGPRLAVYTLLEHWLADQLQYANDYYREPPAPGGLAGVTIDAGDADGDGQQDDPAWLPPPLPLRPGDQPGTSRSASPR